MIRRTTLAMLLVAPLQSCTSDSRAAEPARARSAAQSPAQRVPAAPATPATSGTPATSAAPDLAGRFVTHAEYLRPGLVPPQPGFVLRNPHEGDAAAVATGAKLFVAYNCVDCHGADGSGAMGPSLADGRWHFGGAPAEVFESIYQGRPEGMPAWGHLISPDQIWLLVSYVRSLEANKNVTTENFSGQTVERTGH